MVDIQVIIPVGPGHEDIAADACASAMALNLDVLPIDDTKGRMGRSKARNVAVQMATAEWLFFLDADDILHKGAKKAFKYMRDYDAIWGLINDGQVRVPQVRNVDYKTLLHHDPTQTLQMGHFVRRKIALKYPFDESMDCGEDFDYYFRIWKQEKCIKIPHSLFINRRGNHSIGPRSANGRQWREAVSKLQVQCREGNRIKKVGDMFLPASDRMFVQAFEQGDAFDGKSLRTALGYCKNRRTAVDGGAHVGSWTKVLNKQFDRVIAFEPSKDNYRCLQKNVEGAEIYNKAVGESFRQVDIEITDPQNTGQNHVKEGEGIEMVPIDSLNLDNVDFLKLDVEGYEYNALLGASETLKRCNPVVLIEVNGLAQRYGFNDEDAKEYLVSLGYKLQEVVNKDYIYAR